MRQFLEGLTALTALPGLSYQREYGPRFSMTDIARGKQYRRPSVEIVRYIVDVRPGNHLPPLLVASRQLAATRGPGTEPLIRDMLAVFGGGRGGYLLEIPGNRGCQEVAKTFLGWLETEMKKSEESEKQQK